MTKAAPLFAVAAATLLTLSACEQKAPEVVGGAAPDAVAEEVLARHGFEPSRQSPGCVRLLNCPFHPLAARSPDVVCGINHAFLAGFLTGLRATGTEATLDPRSGECCVQLHRSARTG